MCWNVFPAILDWPCRSTPSPADGFEEMLLSWPSHTHSLQQRPGGLTSWGLGQLSAGLCRSSLHRGTQVTPPPRQWQSWAQEGWNTCPSSSFLPFITQPSSFWPAHSTRRLTSSLLCQVWGWVMGNGSDRWRTVRSLASNSQVNNVAVTAISLLICFIKKRKKKLKEVSVPNGFLGNQDE